MTRIKRNTKYDVHNVPAKDILVDTSFNCRGDFTVESVQALAEGIRDHGLNFPIVVQPIEDVPGDYPGYTHRVVAGHRRFKAVTLFLKWKTIPCMVRKGLTEDEARLINFTENLERKDLNIWQEAVWLGNRYPEGVKIKDAAKEIKRPERWVHIRLRLLKLPHQVQRLAETGQLTMVDLEAICQQPQERQVRAAEQIVAAKASGKVGRQLPFRRRFIPKKSKEQISEMIAKMLTIGITGLGPRIAAWCAGYVSDEEIDVDLKEELKKSGEG